MTIDILRESLAWNLKMHGMCEEQLWKCKELYKAAEEAQQVRREHIKKLYDQIKELEHVNP